MRVRYLREGVGEGVSCTTVDISRVVQTLVSHPCVWTDVMRCHTWAFCPTSQFLSFLAQTCCCNYLDPRERVEKEEGTSVSEADVSDRFLLAKMRTHQIF